MINFAQEAEKYREEFLELLKEWIQIPSVFDNNTVSPIAPFGKQVKNTLDWFEALGTKDNFITKNVDGFATHIEYGEGSEIVYVFGHGDVVPAGEGWSSDPFKLEIKEDQIFGRGVVDDKGPLIAAYLALKLIRENDLKINRKIRIVAGGNEESEFRCIRHYFSKEPKPTYGFTPDAKFPVIHGEKGGGIIKITGSIENKNIQITGGEAHNIIPYSVLIKNLKSFPNNSLLDGFSKEENIKFVETAENESKVLKVNGKGGHSSKPEKAVNPIEKSVKFLSQCLNEKWILTLHNLIGQHNLNGQLYGLDREGKCGRLMLVPTIIEIKNGILQLTLSVRYPENISFEEILKTISNYFAKNRINEYKIEGKNIKNPNYVPSDSKLVKKLYDIYVKHTGDLANKVRVTSAGTYASEMSNSVIFGCEFPDGSAGSTHEKNEFGSINAFVKAIGIYAEALYELSNL